MKNNRLIVATVEAPKTEHGCQVQAGRDYIVVVFDNEFNSFEEVTFILMLATGCPPNEAEMETWEIHHLGKSVVHNAREQECMRVAEIISTIGIRVEVVKED